ncbi:hypothetical protein DM01DRAFT_1312425 [Hesseltinella vesiculosa]|uniref:tRNA (cytosine(38)-C(5))-methyltransferase n=1 Tax=Hesseltinella vesiculosa TaxID=101127 RepID=A0A1X2G584_9FUNG|nr:hypothetical protein DM01DRAFT_1312425 [Hesseltinella vesiculosa]
MTLKVLEFYSGIGGMHYASLLANWDCRILKAFDVNDIANRIYGYNFGNETIGQHLIEGLDAMYFDNWRADVWTLSPPCQPYTRTGMQRASHDPRSKSFIYLLHVLDVMNHRPTYILVENVKGFETSDSRDMLVRQLQKSGYYFQEFLLNPKAVLGMPNSRLRYYLLARLHPSFDGDGQLVDKLPSHLNAPSYPSCIGSYLTNEANLEEYSVPNKVLLKMGNVFDIVKATDVSSCCFTKGYSHYAQGTGSILQTNLEVDTVEVFEAIEKAKQQGDDEKQIQLYRSLKLRYFTPREIANLMGFPSDFNFPSTVSKKQQYRTLGNSINVALVAQLMRYLVA